MNTVEHVFLLRISCWILAQIFRSDTSSSFQSDCRGASCAQLDGRGVRPYIRSSSLREVALIYTGKLIA
jgi:hypothetical protein